MKLYTLYQLNTITVPIEELEDYDVKCLLFYTYSEVIHEVVIPLYKLEEAEEIKDKNREIIKLLLENKIGE